MPLYFIIYIMLIIFCENLFTFFTFVCMCVCVSVGRCTGAIACQWRSEVRSQFSPPTVGLPEAKLGLSDLSAGVFICRAILPALRNVSTVRRIYLLLRLDRTSPDCLFSSCLCSHCPLLLPCSVWHAFWFLRYLFKSHLLGDISSNTMSVSLGCFSVVQCHVFLAGTCYS